MSADRKVAHTPGPWFARGCEVVDADGGFIAECQTADAPVIAAAPDLLAALIAASHALKSYQYGNSATDLAEQTANACDAAIAKALGS